MTTGTDVVREARSWRGTPWIHAQSTKGVGCDCIGLIGGVANELGISDAWVNGAGARYKGYGRLPNPDMLLGGCDEFMDQVHKPWQLGDILVLRFQREPQHFAFVSRLNPHYMIHNWQRRQKIGVVTENRINDLWASRIVRAYRFRGLT